MSQPRVEHERRPISLRHIKMADIGDSGAVQVLGVLFAPQDLEGINGPDGWVNEDYTISLGDVGDFTLTLPNGHGGDGILHRRRFQVLTDPGYESGDEWIEVWDGATPGLDDKPLFVGTPTGYVKTSSQVQITGFDPQKVLELVRENACGFWRHAPRDVFEHYCRVWRPLLAVNSFPSASLSASTGGPGASVTYGSDGGAELASSSGALAMLSTGYTLDLGVSDPHDAWRVEATIDVPAFSLVTEGVTLMIDDGTNVVSVIVTSTELVIQFPNTSQTSTVPSPTLPCTVEIAVERHDTWLYFYANGQLLGAGAVPTPTGLLSLSLIASSHASTVSVVRSVLVRRADRLLCPDGHGDLRLPGLPTPGGLYSEFFDDSDLPAASRLVTALNPLRTPNGAGIGIPQPPNVPAANGSNRSFGAIYLDFDANPNGLKVRWRFTGTATACRIYIGKTRRGEACIDDWTAGGARTVTSINLATHLTDADGNPPVSGWYPIVYELAHVNGSLGSAFEISPLDGSGNPTGWATVDNSILAPEGIYSQQVRYDSHLAQIEQLRDSFALQYVPDFRGLENPAFPCVLAPRVRVGRDTDKTIDKTSGIQPQVTGDATETIDAILCDAAGLSDDNTQLTVEQLDYDSLARHLAIHSDQESLSDITVSALLTQRARTLQALRGEVWEEATVQPVTGREKLPGFLLPAPADFDWGAGDGIRFDYPDLDLVDDTPRQIQSVKRTARPQSLSVPAAVFRQRPRSLKQALRRVARSAALARRNFQGQFGTTNGNIGSSASGLDSYTRVPLPPSDAQIVDATLVVVAIAGSGTLEVNGSSTGKTIDKVTDYDVYACVSRAGGAPYMYARLVGATSYSIFLVLKTQL